MTDNEYALIIKAAWYYYLENYTQQEISKLLGVSRAKVVRLLDEAKRDGVIEFTFRQEGNTRMQLERDLIKKYQLSDSFIVPTPADPADLNGNIARAAAMYVNGRIEDNGYLNMGYGDSTSLILSNLATNASKTLNVISLTGGVNYYLPKVRSNLFSVKLFLIPSPLLLSDTALRDALFQEPDVQDIYRMVTHSNMSIVGIGGMAGDSTILRNNILSQSEFRLLKMQGAVGDILSHFIDKDGNPIDADVEKRLMSTSLETLQDLDNVVGIAGGPSKVTAIHAALVHDYIDVLVTDEDTAKSLLDYRESESRGE